MKNREIIIFIRSGSRLIDGSSLWKLNIRQFQSTNALPISINRVLETGQKKLITNNLQLTDLPMVNILIR